MAKVVIFIEPEHFKDYITCYKNTVDQVWIFYVAEFNIPMKKKRLHQKESPKRNREIIGCCARSPSPLMAAGLEKQQCVCIAFVKLEIEIFDMRDEIFLVFVLRSETSMFFEHSMWVKCFFFIVNSYVLDMLLK